MPTDSQEVLEGGFPGWLELSEEKKLAVIEEVLNRDIRPYIALLEDRYVQELDDLMKIQIREYMAFIKDFTSRANSMSKNFFIVVPYDPAILARGGGGRGGALGSLFPSSGNTTTLTNEQFEQYRTQLEQRISVIEQGLVRTGVRVVSLGTEEVIELFYKLFNPGELEKPLQVTQIAR